jgi:hypothetical protein
MVVFTASSTPFTRSRLCVTTGPDFVDVVERASLASCLFSGSYFEGDL